MDSTRRILAALATAVALPAAAINHENTINPIARGPFAVVPTTSAQSATASVNDGNSRAAARTCCDFTADRASLRLSPATPDWSAELARLAGVHRWVLTGLGLIFATGSLMALADLDGVMRSVVFWVKMGLVGLLLANGYLRMRSETALRQGVSDAWTGFRRTSGASLVLWFVVLLAGALLHSTL